MATYKLIASSTVGSGGASNIEFTSIPGTYTDLVLKYSGRDTSTNSNNVFANIFVTFNNSTSSIYTTRYLYADGSTPASNNLSNEANFRVMYSNSDYATASTFSNLEIYIPNYAGSNNKSVSYDNVVENNGTACWMVLGASLWASTSAITSIKLAPMTSFKQYSTAYLYGISNA